MPWAIAKDAVLAHSASPIFRIAPYVQFGCMVLAASIVPVIEADLLLAPAADVIALVGVFALARVFSSLAAMDVGKLNWPPSEVDGYYDRVIGRIITDITRANNAAGESALGDVIYETHTAWRGFEPDISIAESIARLQTGTEIVFGAHPDEVHHVDEVGYLQLGQHPAPQHFKIALVRKEVGIDNRRASRVAIGQAHTSPAFGTQHASVEREAVPLHLFAPVVFEHRRHEMPLHVGRR